MSNRRRMAVVAAAVVAASLGAAPQPTRAEELVNECTPYVEAGGRYVTACAYADRAAGPEYTVMAGVVVANEDDGGYMRRVWADEDGAHVEYFTWDYYEQYYVTHSPDYRVWSVGTETDWRDGRCYTRTGYVVVLAPQHVYRDNAYYCF